MYPIETRTALFGLFSLLNRFMLLLQDNQDRVSSSIYFQPFRKTAEDKRFVPERVMPWEFGRRFRGEAFLAATSGSTELHIEVERLRRLPQRLAQRLRLLGNFNQPLRVTVTFSNGTVTVAQVHLPDGRRETYSAPSQEKAQLAIQSAQEFLFNSWRLSPSEVGVEPEA